jgi:nitrogen fixation protein FixH
MGRTNTLHTIEPTTGVDTLPSHATRARTIPMRTSRSGEIWMGCLVVLGIIIAALVFGAWYTSQNWRGWVAPPIRQAMTDGLAQASLPDEQRVALENEINGLIDSFEQGNLSMQEIGLIAQEFVESPLLPAAIVMGFDKSYYEPSTLSEEEKLEARKQMSRFIHGLTSEQIVLTKVDDTMAPISDPQGEIVIDTGSMSVKLKSPERVTPEELREVTALMKTAADEAQIEDVLIEINVAQEFTEMVDRALGRTPAALPPAVDPAAPERVPSLPAPADPAPEGGNPG